MDRDVFYRLSLSEMFVPYGDPRNPIYRKGAFDLGNVGAGVTANNLSCEMTFRLNPFCRGCYLTMDPSGVRLPRSDQIFRWACC